MQEQWFDILLKDNIVLSSHAATEGSHHSLDYLPGSTFLGVLAARMFQKGGAHLFLSGRLRCSPALPLCNGQLAFPIPLSLHTYKESDNYEIIDGLSLSDDKLKKFADDGQNIQQLRSDFVTAKGELLSVRMGKITKSATDRNKFDQSAKSQLFSYQYLCRDQRFAFRLQADDDLDLTPLTKLLTSGGISIGRSRSAEFGRISITRCEPLKLPAMAATADSNIVSFLLASDLALYHQGVPTLCPKPEDFDIKGIFLPEKSFIRTRNYSPWNNYRQCRDPERQLITAGSVISFILSGDGLQQQLPAVQARLAPGIGAYRNEGLGWLLCNPAIITAPPARLTLITQAGRAAQPDQPPDSPLADLLVFRRNHQIVAAAARSEGEEWAGQWWQTQNEITAMQGKIPSKAQWAQIREFTCAAGNDLESLVQKIEQFTQHAERQSFWHNFKIKQKGKVVSLADLVEQKLDPDEIQKLSERHGITDAEAKKTLISTALYNAAREIGRRYDR